MTSLKLLGCCNKFHIQPPFLNGQGHMTKIAAMPLYGKNLKPSSPEPMDGWRKNLVCGIEYPSTTKIVQMMNLVWTWSFFSWQGQIWENIYPKGFMGNFEDFGLKMVIRFVLMSTWRFVSRRGQGHCLTFDPWLTIIWQYQTSQKPRSQLQLHFICRLQGW